MEISDRILELLQDSKTNVSGEEMAEQEPF